MFITYPPAVHRHVIIAAVTTHEAVEALVAVEGALVRKRVQSAIDMVLCGALSAAIVAHGFHPQIQTRYRLAT